MRGMVCRFAALVVSNGKAASRRYSTGCSLNHAACGRHGGLAECLDRQAPAGQRQAEHLFALKQALGAFDFVGTQLAECDAWT